MVENDAPQARLDFRSKEDFRETCMTLAARMHYLNRVAMGESHFAWEVARALSRLGQVFDAHFDNADTQALFGDGWTAGTLDRDAARAYLLALIEAPD